MRQHIAVARAVSASIVALAASKPAAQPTAVAAAAATSAAASRPTAYPLNGFNYLTVAPSNAPYQSEQKQYGTNACAKYGPSRQDSMCQNAYVNSAEDFCLWGPPYSNGLNSSIANTERYEVAWCTKSGYGTRLIPDGTLTSVHFIQTPSYVQVTGTGNFQNIGLPVGDAGGELDPHGDDETGNPQGGLVFSSGFANANGATQQSHQWTLFLSSSVFCFRVCQDGPLAAAQCQHIYDVMGCDWNMPAAPLVPGTFETCKGDAANPPMGLYVTGASTSTFHQGDPTTPSAHPAPASSLCTPLSSIPTNGAVVAAAYASLGATGVVASAASASLASGNILIPTPAAAVASGASGSNSILGLSVLAGELKSASTRLDVRPGLLLVGALALLICLC